MKFILNEFLTAVSFALDFVEMDILGRTTNHSKRVAYTSLKIGQILNMSFEELHDLSAYAILHDNGMSEKTLHDILMYEDIKDINSIERRKEHCELGEQNIINYPFLTGSKDIIKYHHEKFDGTGFYNISGNEIPFMSQVIFLSDTIDINFDIKNNDSKDIIVAFIKDNTSSMFSPVIADAFLKVAKSNDFWVNLKNDNINSALKNAIPQQVITLSLESIREITRTFSRIIDSKSKFTQKHSRGLSEKACMMADFYNYDNDKKIKLVIAADLHDIGKLGVPNSILDNPKALTKLDFDTIKKHPYYTRLALQEITGFEDITEWAANHHEKLNGKGYPYGFTGENLDFNSRLMGCLDIYQALTEDRPYRKPLNHSEAMNILDKMVTDGLIDGKIVNDLNYVFKDTL